VSGRKYIVPRNRVQIGQAVLKAMQDRQFVHDRPTFRDDREARMFDRIVKGAQYVAEMEAGAALSAGQLAHLDRLNVRVEDGRVRIWGWLSGPWLVRAYGHGVNLRVGDTDDYRHPEYVKPVPGAAPEA
jgi:hypothetical protein